MGPEKWTEPTLLSLYKNIGDELTVSVVFTTAYRHPTGYVVFQTGIGFNSRYCSKVLMETGIVPEQRLLRYTDGFVSALFQVDLQHLKSSALEGSESLHWKASEFPGYEEQGAQWIADWKQYGRAFVDSVSTLDEAIKFYEWIPSYTKMPWVKSDGYSTFSPHLDLALLYVQRGDIEKAKQILRAVLSSPLPRYEFDESSALLKWLEEKKLS